MKGETKVLLGILGVTAAIIVGAVLLLNKSTASTQPKVADTSVLIRSDSQKISTASATITLVEFGDYQCPACGAYHPLVKKLIEEFSDKLTFYFRNFPLSQHKNALISAYAAEAAGNQGKFWEMYDLTYQNQTTWSDSDNAKDIFAGYAKNLKLDLTQFKKDVDSDAIHQNVERDRQDGYALNVNSTPTFFLNGEKLENPRSYEDFKTLIKAAILKAPISQAPAEKYHTHFDLKVYLNGKMVDFTQEKYQSKDGHELNEDIHVHDGNGEIVHIHKKGATLGEFFKSLPMNLSASCLETDTKEKHCNDTNNSLKLLVNGKENNQFENYQPQDLDRVLISYGLKTDNQLSAQINSVSDRACIYSLSCPERGKPPTEKCVGGLGSDCKD